MIGVDIFLVLLTAPCDGFLDDLVKNVRQPNGDRLVWPRLRAPDGSSITVWYFFGKLLGPPPTSM